MLLVVNELLAGVTTTGTDGAVRSTVKVLVLENTLVFPAMSVAVAFTVCDAALSAVVGVKLQAPPGPEVVLPTRALSM